MWLYASWSRGWCAGWFFDPHAPVLMSLCLKCLGQVLYPYGVNDVALLVYISRAQLCCGGLTLLGKRTCWSWSTLTTWPEWSNTFFEEICINVHQHVWINIIYKQHKTTQTTHCTKYRDTQVMKKSSNISSPFLKHTPEILQQVVIYFLYLVIQNNVLVIKRGALKLLLRERVCLRRWSHSNNDETQSTLRASYQ